MDQLIIKTTTAKCNRIINKVKCSEMFLFNSITFFQPEKDWIWLGLQRSRSGEFSQWFSSQSDLNFTNWAAGEPDNRLGDENCVSMLRNDGHWDDLPCDYSPVKTLCEKITESHEGY